ncbi:hypothetical protein JD844_021658 [Phrynosoma platyrhinos]|uniref:Sodium-coupled monocarboxylate transporter 2 n=1 Tax=Phrynosoma platyrhinos TaxID=52577 RepID=A0ABQ7SU66_PHRPL|nr:hypothetical protein JD844_021658 [Phrynosoma platyrhinos]
MTCGPVALSLTASFMSAVTVLGTPAEVYRHGSAFILFFIAYTFVIIFTSELFLPIFYRSGITSTYEYLELRFNKPVRIAATLIYIVQTILYAGVVVYAPALALNQVTGFNLWGSVFATGIVCTFYCTLGGLKAVVWTDAFQLVIMLIGFLTVLIQGTLKNGGLTNIWENAGNGSRLTIFDFDVDPLRRHTFWTIAVGGTFTWLGIYGVNQSTIQRCISCKTELHARLSCDPWTAGFISAPDQLMPYFVMIIFSSTPGLPGLFVACAFSGTLSTVAASINALATVTSEDFVKNCFPHLSEHISTWISKGLCIVFGVICTSMAVAASVMGGVVQASLSILGMCGGPMLGLFTLGIIFPWTTWKASSGRYLVFCVISLLQCYWVPWMHYGRASDQFCDSQRCPNKGEDIKPMLIRPVCNVFCFWSHKCKTFWWCGVDQEDHKALHEEFSNEQLKDLSEKADDNNVLKNGLNRAVQSHLPSYNPCEKSYTNPSVERESHF